MNAVRSFPRFVPCRRLAAFTLVEMLITLAVFVLLSAAIFGIIMGVLQSANTLQEDQNRGDQSMALQAFLKRKLGDLPGRSLLGSYRRGDGEGLDQNGIIFGTDNFLTAIDAKVQPNGLYTLRLATFSSGGTADNAPAIFQQALAQDDSSITWTSLIRDVQHVAWRFQDPSSLQWQDLWNNPGIKPNLVELSVQLAGDLHSSVMDFWIPPIYAVTLVPVATGHAAVTNAATTNTAPTPVTP